MDIVSECSASSPEYDHCYTAEETASDDEFRPHTLPRAAKPGSSSAAAATAKKGKGLF